MVKENTIFFLTLLCVRGKMCFFRVYNFPVKQKRMVREVGKDREDALLNRLSGLNVREYEWSEDTQNLALVVVPVVVVTVVVIVVFVIIWYNEIYFLARISLNTKILFTKNRILFEALSQEDRTVVSGKVR